MQRTLLALALTTCLLAPGSAGAQEKPQKGVGVGALETRSQIRSDNDQQRLLTDAQAQAQESMRQRARLSAQQTTDIFLKLDVNGDGVLTRSELPAGLAGLRATFARYDRDQDHRLTYSEFCDYADAAPARVLALHGAAAHP
jgi:Ca2+-binding EF-hand superfamily protein